MSQQQALKESLVCTPEVARAIFENLTVKGRANVDKELPVAAANWQRGRIVEHLKAKLVDAQTQLKKINEVAAHVEQYGTARALSYGRTEGHIMLLQSLLVELDP